MSEEAAQRPEDDAPLDPGLLEILACPDCKAPIAQEGAWLVCQSPECAKRYPIRDGIPVLLEGRWEGSVFASDRILVKHDESYESREDYQTRTSEAEQGGNAPAGGEPAG